MAMRKITPEKMSKEMAGTPTMIHYPSFYIGTEHLPEAKSWKVGKTYDIKIRVKQTGISMRKGHDGKEHGSADFDVVGIEPGGIVKNGAKRYTEE